MMFVIEKRAYDIRSWFTRISVCFLFIMISVNLISSAMFTQQNERGESGTEIDNRNTCELPWWDGALDDCSSVMRTFIAQHNTTRSYCGKRADVPGKGQKVISYCFFGSFDDYASGLPNIIQSVQELYPGWVVRLYTEPQNYERELTPLLLQYKNFYVCDVANLPGNIPDVRRTDPRLWRAAAIGDELVDVFLSRDIDAVILEREVSAVQEFLESGKTLHTMRDHHSQGSRILCGMFGIRQRLDNLQTLNTMRRRLFAASNDSYNHLDQALLKLHVYKKLMNDVITHDSYRCTEYKDARPFPSQREDGKYIGNRGYKVGLNNSGDRVKIKCPVECRPADHPDWEYC